MLEAGGILIVMCSIFFVGMLSQGILSSFYKSSLKDASDMERPGKKLMKLSKLRYETSYYLNGTVHNAKSMVHGMLENYKLAGLRLWTWHHIGIVTELLCGAIGLTVGGIYVLGNYIPAVKSLFEISGRTALIHVLVGMACVVMLNIWQNVLDNRERRHRLEMAMTDYFDNEKFHQLGREVALSGRVREIVGNRGMTEDPGSEIAMTEERNAKNSEKHEKREKNEPDEMNEKGKTIEKSEKKEKIQSKPVARGKKKIELPERDIQIQLEEFPDVSEEPFETIMLEPEQAEGKAAEPVPQAKTAVEKKPSAKAGKKRTSTTNRKSSKVVSMNRDEEAGAEEVAATETSVKKKTSTSGTSGSSKTARKRENITEKEEQLLSLLREFMDIQN